MDTETYDKWKVVLLKHLGRRMVGKFEGLVLNIVCVDKGMKPAYLYDIGCPKPDQLYSLVVDLVQSGLIENNLNVLQLDMDYLIVNVRTVQSAIPLPEILSTRLIDISKQSELSMVTDSTVVSEIYNTLMTLISKMTQDRVLLYSHTFSTNDNCNVTSLFGFLLGYPLVYWYDMKDSGETAYLAMEPLCCVNVTVDYCVPGCRNRYTTGTDLVKKQHLLYAFSYPESFKIELENGVETWFKSVKSLVIDGPCEWLKNVSHNVEVKSYPSLSL